MCPTSVFRTVMRSFRYMVKRNVMTSNNIKDVKKYRSSLTVFGNGWAALEQ